MAASLTIPLSWNIICILVPSPLAMDSSGIALVERRMDTLEARISALELESGGAESDSGALQFKLTTLARLKQIRELLFTEASQGVSDPVLVEERDALRKENERLRKETDRLRYRIDHLLRSLNEEEQRNKRQGS